MLAIVVVAYNRTESVSRLLNSLNNAHYIQQVPLIISIDKSNTDEVENLADSFVWTHGKKRVIKHKSNLGLRDHIMSIGKLTEEYENLIVLEDDLVVSNCFYDYALAAIEKYKDSNEIAGISLYSPNYNFYLSKPFVARKDEYDVYLMQIAQSWGQIWMRRQWNEFYEWYKNISDNFSVLSHLPINICKWGKNSWLKYHCRYCIEKSKFFVYPYVSMTSNMGYSGTHSSVGTNLTRTMLQSGNKFQFHLPEIAFATKYDGFYESLNLSISFPDKDICIDLYGLKGNFEGKRYWLTTKLAEFHIEKSYGVAYYPIEENVIKDIVGKVIYLYDTQKIEKNSMPDNTFELMSYFFKIRAIYTNIKKTGVINFIFKAIDGLYSQRF